MGTRRLLVTKSDGSQFKIEVPDDAKITFGYFNPVGHGEQAGRYDDSRGDLKKSCLRIYRGTKDNGEQLAAFTGVREFRDVSLRVERLVKQQVGEAKWQGDDEGNLEESRKVTVSRSLVTDDDLMGELPAG